MIEILAQNLDYRIKYSNYKAIKTFEGGDYFSEPLQVWEMTKEDFDKMTFACFNGDIIDWWVYSEGSNMGKVNTILTINGHEIKAWASEEDDVLDESYDSLLEYFDYALGTSCEINICALATDLAKQNNMTMGELFKKYA